MPSILRSRVALAALIGVFLIPIVGTSMRGLTHVLTCEDQVETPFTVVIDEGAAPIVLSSRQLTAGEDEGLGDPVRLEGVFQGAHHRLLPDEVGKGFGPVFSRENLVGFVACIGHASPGACESGEI